ncbi:lipopolysaccharide heptosyltransferase II [bacterium]|nr:lipopolysaccharide heptosyltransferase II [bacterium]RQV98561.1 MAG: lipopolysaccharide heptosyltransferase II [bacterium]
MLNNDSGDVLKRILIVRLSAMGDVLLTTPLIRCLKRQFPDCEIDFLVKETYGTLIQNNPSLHHIWMLPSEKGFLDFVHLCRQIRKKKYDGIIDLQVNLRSFAVRIFSQAKRKVRYKTWRGKRFLLVHFHWNIYKSCLPVPLRFLNAASLWKVEDDGWGLELFVNEKAVTVVRSRLAERGMDSKDRIIVLAPGASKMTKRWPSENFTRLGNIFFKMNYRIILVGGHQDQDVCKDIQEAMETTPENFAAQLSIQETAALINESVLLITNDTGVMHLGAALKKPVVAIFGPTTHHLGFIPFRTQSIVVEKSLSCRPCSYHGTDVCPKGHFHCMKDIPVEDVLKAAKNLLDER